MRGVSTKGPQEELCRYWGMKCGEAGGKRGVWLAGVILHMWVEPAHRLRGGNSKVRLPGLNASSTMHC